MREFTDEQLQAMTLEQAEAEITNAVYDAARIIEALEYKGKIRGNGHHIRQEIAGMAKKLMNERWIETRATPNDLKLSDSGVRRGSCVVGGKAAVEAATVTHGAVRCSAWLGVAVIWN